MRVLITGGAGYIGSHTVRRLLDLNCAVFVLDDLSTGHAWAIDPRAEFFEGSLSDKHFLQSIVHKNKITSVIHFAALSLVADSVKDPLSYYDNNITGLLGLLEACVESDVSSFILSSTASVYGEPPPETSFKIPEDALKNPINPYGNTKLACENLLIDFAKSPLAPPNFKYSILRYFNVAGASLDQNLGQASKVPSHLVKVASLVACGARQQLEIYGQDYLTPDGTCVRDYIHVEDLVSAHLDALNYIASGGSSEIFNCGYGSGFSVLEVIHAMKKVSQNNFLVKTSVRRAGDPAILVADNSKIKKILGWKPRYDDIELICKTAYLWEKKYLTSYDK